MANLIEVVVKTSDDTDYSAIEARAGEAGAKTGAAFEAGSSAPILSLADRMRAGYDNAFSEMESGTRDFTDAQLGTFKDYYSSLADQGDKSAADMLTRVRSLGGEAEVAAEDIAASVSTSLGNGFQDAGTASGGIFTRAFTREASAGVADFSVLGAGLERSAEPAGSGFAVKFSSAAKDGIQEANIAGILGTDTAFKSLGEEAGVDFAEGFTEKAATPSGGGAKAPTASSGAGESSGDGMGKLMVAGIVGGIGLGAPLILGALGPVMTGITALALKSNVTIAADYKQLGTTISTTFQQAASPLTGTLHQALMSVDQDVQHLGPGLQAMFANAEPDITTVTAGIEGFASNVLPGMTSALGGSQVIVSDFAASMPGLGSSVGDFFQGLDTDATTTGAGLQSVFGVIGNAAGTLGHVLGSASSAISTDLLAIDPVVNTVLTTVRQLTNPATIGAAGGAFAAFKLDPSISSGLTKMSSGMMDVADKAASSTGMLSKFSGAALGSASALDSAAGVMSGPWGIAIGAGVGLLSGFVGSMLSASHASDALSLSQQGLADALAKDGNTGGQATAAYIAQSDAANGLTDSANKAGVSVTTWTQAVMGNKDAQAAVTSAVDKLNQAQLGQMTTAAANANVTSHAMGDLQGGTVTVLAHSQAVNKLTDANQQLLGSMSTQANQIASDITKQAELTQATNALNSSTAIFNATMAAGYQAMVQSATTAGDNAVSVLNLGTSQSALNQQLAAAVTFYQESTDAASGYQTILTSLNGTAMGLAQAQNTLAQDELNAATSFRTNKDSMDQHTASGIADRQAIVSAATAIQALGVQTEQSTGSMSAANGVIQQQITAFVNATGATGKQKTAIQQYIESLTQIPPDVNTNVNANVGPAKQDVMSFLSWVDNEAAVTGTIQVNMGSIKQSGQGHAYGGTTSVAATGGDRGGSVLMNERGAELVNLPDGSRVTPASNMASLAASGAFGSASSGPLQLEWVGGGGDEFARFIVQLLRTHVQAVGGGGTNSVQRALGQVA